MRGKERRGGRRKEGWGGSRDGKEGGTGRKEGRGEGKNEEVDKKKMKNEKVAKGRIIGLAVPCFLSSFSRLNGVKISLTHVHSFYCRSPLFRPSGCPISKIYLFSSDLNHLLLKM